MEAVKGLTALRDVIRCLRETGRYTDEEGEATNALEDLARAAAERAARMTEDRRCGTCLHAHFAKGTPVPRPPRAEGDCGAPMPFLAVPDSVQLALTRVRIRAGQGQECPRWELLHR